MSSRYTDYISEMIDYLEERGLDYTVYTTHVSVRVRVNVPSMDVDDYVYLNATSIRDLEACIV